MAAVLYKMDKLYSYGPGDVDLPDVMYKVAPILDRKVGDISAELEDLKHQQDCLLSKLDSMLQEVGVLSQNNASVTIRSDASRCKFAVVTDIVIHANPTDPPLSLKYFVQTLKKQKKTLLKCHLHSSLRKTPALDLLWTNEESADRSRFEFIVTIIWSNVADTTVHINPSVHACIRGETNLARLFGRLLKIYDCDASAVTSSSATDAYLDACDILSTTFGMEKKKSTLEFLDSILKQQSWLGGKTFSLADAVASSAVSKHIGDAKQPNLKKWLKACSKFM